MQTEAAVSINLTYLCFPESSTWHWNTSLLFHERVLPRIRCSPHTLSHQTTWSWEAIIRKYKSTFQAEVMLLFSLLNSGQQMHRPHSECVWLGVVLRLNQASRTLSTAPPWSNTPAQYASKLNRTVFSASEDNELESVIPVLTRQEDNHKLEVSLGYRARPSCKVKWKGGGERGKPAISQIWEHTPIVLPTHQANMGWRLLEVDS